MRHLLLPGETDAYRGRGGERERKKERERRNDRETEGESADVANIFPLQGAGAEGPSAVNCNRTGLFVSAQGSLRAINGTQNPLCRGLVSVSLETDKHIIHKCQTVCVQCDAMAGGGQDFWDCGAAVIPMLCADTVNDFTKKEGDAWDTPRTAAREVYNWGAALANIESHYGLER